MGVVAGRRNDPNIVCTCEQMNKKNTIKIFFQKDILMKKHNVFP
jgi:hypothetical protein